MMKNKLFFKNKNKSDNLPFKSQKWWHKLLWTFLLFLLIISVLKITLIGVVINDLLFEFWWGWLKYFWMLIILILIINKIFNNHFFTYLKTKMFWNRKFFLKIGWLFFSCLLVVGLANIIYFKGWTWDYKAYLFHKNFLEFYHWEIIQKKWTWMQEINFFEILKDLSTPESFGGIIGFIIAGIFCYFHILGAILLTTINFFLLISYMINNAIFYYFYSKTKKEKIHWENLNRKNIYKMKTNIINKIDDQDITIEIQKAQKIHGNEKEFLMQNEKEFINILESKEKENISEEKIILEKKHPSIKHHENKNESELITSNQEKINEEETSKIITDPSEEINVATKEIAINKNNHPTFDIFQKDEDSLIYATKLYKNKEIQKCKINYQTKIEALFENHHVQAKINNIIIGPRVIRFEISLLPGIKVQNILSLEPELKHTLANKNIFIETVSGGRSLIGIDVPIPDEFLIIIDWKETIKKIDTHHFNLPLAFGKNSMNEIEIVDLNKLPHLLIAGRTGGGKSVSLTTMIATLTYHKSPLELKILLIDPKRVELSIFKSLPHLLGPIITKTHLVANALEEIIVEIEKRFQLFENMMVRDLKEYNLKVNKTEKLPYLVIVIDELADLILRFRKQIEDKIVRICQIARAAGVHMILATQRPSVNIITALIKANIPGRIAFSVTNNFDSRTIINTNGAEKLLGIGDMLFVNSGKPAIRIQGSYIKSKDIKTLNNYWKNIYNEENYYWEQFLEKNLISSEEEEIESYLNLNENDQKVYQEIKNYIRRLEKVSVSLLQRRFNIGFNRAARMLEKLESEGYISKADGNKPRLVLKKTL